jgi:hypothetical protein
MSIWKIIQETLFNIEFQYSCRSHRWITRKQKILQLEANTNKRQNNKLMKDTEVYIFKNVYTNLP